MVNGGRPLKGRRVLIVEGDYVLACGLRRLMQEAGATVIGPAWSEQAGLDLVASEVFDAALLGAKLTHGSVEPIATRLSEGGVPFVVVTDHDSDFAPALREASYVDTSFHHLDLVAAVANSLAGSNRTTAPPRPTSPRPTRALKRTRAIPPLPGQAAHPMATNHRTEGRPR